jgi:hypothetical protein
LKKRILILLILFAKNSFSGFDFKSLYFSTGLINTSYAERESALKSDSEDEESTKPASGSTSTIVIDAQYDFYTDNSKTFYGHVAAPLLGSAGSSIFLGGGGVNFYFGSLSSKAEFKDKDIILKVMPLLRYYWGIDANIGYLVYTTETAKKADIMLDLGAHGGGIYTVSDKLGVKAELGISRGTGVATSSMNMKILIGASYFFDF